MFKLGKIVNKYIIFDDIISRKFSCSLEFQEFLFQVSRRFRHSLLENQGWIRRLKLDPTDIPSLSKNKLKVLKENLTD